MEQKANIVNFFLPNLVFNHSPYLSDLAPCDYFLFPKLKMKLNGKQFNTILDI